MVYPSMRPPWLLFIVDIFQGRNYAVKIVREILYFVAYAQKTLRRESQFMR